MTGRRTETAHPRRLVADSSLVDLALVLTDAIGHPFGHDWECDGALRFICPKCGHVDHNGGTAVVLDAWRWRCHKCRFTGTRQMLERLVLEDATALELLYQFAEVPS